MSRVVVVGAGAGGLAAAARLAVKGHRVTVLEAAEHVGGKLRTYRRDGFAFDTGPSLFTLPAVYRDLFLKTGAPLEEAVDLQPVEPGFAYRWADGTRAVLPGVDPAKCADALGDALGGLAHERWRTLIQRGGAMWRITREPFLQSPLTGWRDLLSLARTPSDITTVAPFSTLRSLGTSMLRDPRLVTLLDRYATYAGSDPRKAPAVLATIPYVEQTFGAWHLGGGLGTLADALAARCDERGVQLRTGTPVARIEADAARGGVSAVFTDDGERIPAEIVVANADAGQVYGSLLPQTGPVPGLRRAVERTPQSLAGFVILLAVRGTTPGIEHHNVWFPADYDAEFDAVFGRRAEPVPDPTIYACVPKDPLMRPSGCESWFILVNAPRHAPMHASGTVDWTETGLAERYADRVLDTLAARGVDLRDRILWREISTPADLERTVRAPGGAIYGTSSNGARAAFQRPANASPVPGLFLVGGSSHPGGGLPLVGMSAEIVANLVGRAR